MLKHGEPPSRFLERTEIVYGFRISLAVIWIKDNMLFNSFQHMMWFEKVTASVSLAFKSISRSSYSWNPDEGDCLWTPGFILPSCKFTLVLPQPPYRYDIFITSVSLIEAGFSFFLWLKGEQKLINNTGHSGHFCTSLSQSHIGQSKANWLQRGARGAQNAHIKSVMSSLAWQLIFIIYPCRLCSCLEF